MYSQETQAKILRYGSRKLENWWVLDFRNWRRDFGITELLEAFLHVIYEQSSGSLVMHNNFIRHCEQ